MGAAQQEEISSRQLAVAAASCRREAEEEVKEVEELAGSGAALPRLGENVASSSRARLQCLAIASKVNGADCIWRSMPGTTDWRTSSLHTRPELLTKPEQQ